MHVSASFVLAPRSSLQSRHASHSRLLHFESGFGGGASEGVVPAVVWTDVSLAIVVPGASGLGECKVRLKSDSVSDAEAFELPSVPAVVSELPFSDAISGKVRGASNTVNNSILQRMLGMARYLVDQWLEA